MPQPKHHSSTDRRKADAIRLAEIRQRLDTDTTARQEAIANFVLSTAAMARQLREALDIKATGIDAQAMPRFDDFIDELTYRIRFTFHRTFGRELFDCPPEYSIVDSELRPMPADHQAALLRAASLHANMTQPVPGWPMVITANAADAGYFATMRRNHPMTLGEVIDGKRVVATHWHRSPEDGDQPVYRLEGEDEYRLASDTVGRIESISIGVDITRPHAAESITQPPTDGGE